MNARRIESQTEADAMNDDVGAADGSSAQRLHGGDVRIGDDWDTEVAWARPALRQLARGVLLEWRDAGTLPNETTRRALATCCAERED